MTLIADTFTAGSCYHFHVVERDSFCFFFVVAQCNGIFQNFYIGSLKCY